MQRILIVPVIVSVLFVLTGCAGNSNVTGISATPDVFPEEAVGIWQNDEYRWGFKIEPDGSISKIIHTIGVPIVVAEGSTKKVDSEGREAIFILDEYYADYEAESRTLAVVVEINFRIDHPSGIAEGSSRDYFVGTISEDGLTWDVDWRGYGELEGAKPLDQETIDAIDATPQPIIFNKLKIK